MIGLGRASLPWRFRTGRLSRLGLQVLAGSNGARRILVVGGAGYIGSVLCGRLLAEGYRVRVLDPLLYGDESLRAFTHQPNFELLRGESRDVAAIVASMRDVDAVVHLGEIVGDPACALDEAATLEINHFGTRQVAQVAKGFGVSQFIYASSCSVYGASDEVLTEDAPLNPISLYARAKIAAERSLLELQTAAFRPVIFRFGTVYGLSRRPRFDLVVNVLAAGAASDGRIRIDGGDQWRPFVHVVDVARSISIALRTPAEAIGGELFNVGSDAQNHTIGQIGEMVCQRVPTTSVRYSASSGDRRNYRVSFAKIRSRLGFEPKMTVSQGIAEIVSAVGSGLIQNYRDPRYSNLASLRLMTHDMSIRAVRPSGHEIVVPVAQEAIAS